MKSNQPAERSNRIEPLDALRGFAALTVVIAHYLAIFSGTQIPEFQRIDSIKRALGLTPLSMFWASSQAVLVFFILSGFVLTLMLQNRTQSYADYIIRRTLRLWIPYIVSIAVGAFLVWLIGSEPIPELGQWINKFYGVEITWQSLLGHLFFIGHYPTDEFNFVVWTLQHEMRISLIMPLLIPFLATRSGLKFGGILLMSAVSIPLVHFLRRTPFSDLHTYALTTHYLLFFAIGVLLALYREKIQMWFNNQSSMRKTVGLVAILLLYSCLPNLVRKLTGLNVGLFFEWLLIPGTTLLMIYTLCSRRMRLILMHPLFAYLGKISFSLYLYHGVLLVAAIQLFYGKVPIVPLLSVCLVLTFVVSTVMYYLVERPSIQAGKRVARIWSSRTAVAA